MNNRPTAKPAAQRPPLAAAQLSRHVDEMYPPPGTDGVPSLLRRLQVYRPFICPFEHLLPLVPPGASLLDVGCGGGLWLGLLAKLGLVSSGHGFDTSAPAIRLAQAMAARLGAGSDGGPKLTFERRSVADGWPAGSYDVVSVIDVMHHVPPTAQESVIREAANHVKPGGLLLYKDMNERPLGSALMNRLHDLILARQWIHYARIEDVQRWAERAGLVKLGHADLPRLWYQHELMVFGKAK